MAIGKQSGGHVWEFNDEGFIYLSGDSDTDGSIREEIITFNNKTVTEIQKRTDGIWSPSSFKTGPNSLIVGNLISLAAAGNNLITEDLNGDSHFHVRSAVSSGVTTNLANIVHASAFFEESVFRSDVSGEFTGTSISTQDINTAFHLITQKFYFKTGATAATDNIRIQAWSGTDNTGTLLFDQTYPASQFPADSDVTLELDGFLEFELEAETFTTVSSDGTFSLKTNAAEDEWYLAVDFSVIENDDLLQTNQWISGNTFTEGDWSTQDRKIYVCTITGTQTGTFSSNSDKWDLLSTSSELDSIVLSNDLSLIFNNDLNLVTI